MENNIIHLVTDFIGDFFKNEDNSENIGDWLNGAMTKFMPDMSAEEARDSSNIILDTVNSLNDKLKSVQEADNAETWFRDKFNKQTEALSDSEKGKILSQAFNGFSAAESGFTGEAAEKATEIADNEWDNFSLLQMSSDVLKKSGEAALQSLACNTGDLIQQSIEGVVPISVKGAFTSAIGTAVDTGVKCAASGAALIAQKKGWLTKFLPAAATVQEITNIAVGAVENVKTFLAVGSGACSVVDAIDRIQRNVIARAVDFLAVNSPMIGEKIGMIFGPAGAAVGRVIGTGVSFLAKTDAREFIESGLNKVATGARSLISKAANAVKSTAKAVAQKVGSFFGGKR